MHHARRKGLPCSKKYGLEPTIEQKEISSPRKPDTSPVSLKLKRQVAGNSATAINDSRGVDAAQLWGMVFPILSQAVCNVR